MSTVALDLAKVKSKTSIRRDGAASANWLKAPPKPPMPAHMRARRMDARSLERIISRGLEQMEGRADANETAAFLRQLLFIMPTPYEYKYPAIRYADLFPINYGVPTGAKSHAYHQFDEFGQADLMESYSDDAPNAERQGFEVLGQIYSARSEYSYTIQDLRSQMMMGIPLDAMKAVTARRIIERKCDALAAVGDSVRGFTGIANDANALNGVATTKAAGGKLWGSISGATVTPNATANEILNDCNVLLDAVFVGTKGTHTPNTLVFGTQNWAIINTLRLDNFNMKTVADYLLAALPWVDALEYWPQLDVATDASHGTTAGKERILCMERNRENFEIIISQEFEQFPPQPQNLAFKIPCHKRWGGIQMRFPKSISFMDATV